MTGKHKICVWKNVHYMHEMVKKTLNNIAERIKCTAINKTTHHEGFQRLR